jgi:hypothetical protein
VRVHGRRRVVPRHDILHAELGVGRRQVAERRELFDL